MQFEHFSISMEQSIEKVFLQRWGFDTTLPMPFEGYDLEKEQADILREIVKWMDNQPEVWFDDKTINQIIEMYEKDKENNFIGLEAQE